MKVSELSGEQLHWAVAQAEGLVVRVINNLGELVLPNGDFWFPSIDWAQGGPIIEREGIQIQKHLSGWVALPEGAEFSEENYQEGETPLIAAMRCFVASKLGEEINIPEEVSDVANYS